MRSVQSDYVQSLTVEKGYPRASSAAGCELFIAKHAEQGTQLAIGEVSGFGQKPAYQFLVLAQASNML